MLAAHQEGRMVLVALHTVLKEGRGPDYDAVHRRIPAELAEALRAHGVRDWRIWRDGRHVFHTVEVEDYQAMRLGLRDDPANLAWQQRLADLFELPDSYAGDDAGLPPVWSLRQQMDSPQQGD
jgi:L-rhamnose mutarotase